MMQVNTTLVLLIISLFILSANRVPGTIFLLRKAEAM